VLAVLAATFALAASPAQAALDPPQAAVGGSNSKWVSGTLLSQTGLNCSIAIIGNAYTEIMVQGIASYGGLPAVPKVGDEYWTAFLVSIPGNPCGSGASSVVTTLVMPPHTDVDSSRQIRCFGLPYCGSGWQELTGQSWSFLGSSGPYCPTQPSISPYHQGGLQFGFRPLGSGQLFWIFVPVKSTGQLVGAGTSPPDAFRWLTDATGVYENPGLSTVWANVLPGGAAANPFIFFTRDPTIVPYWDADAPDLPGPIPTHSRAEWFANLYSAFEPGFFCWELYYGATASGSPTATCQSSGIGPWNGNVTNVSDSWFVEGGGPNKGYVPFSYDDDPPGTTFTVRWKFTYAGGTQTAFKDTTFRTLNGPDPDGDGVGLNEDSCPDVKGALANGCNPGVQDDPDKDGVYGSADQCPNQDGQGALNGCPGGIVSGPPPPPSPQPSPKVLMGFIQVKKGALFKKAALAKGAP
jgi:hypothetical protein